jgi:uncharacterized lipoprotein YajG
MLMKILIMALATVFLSSACNKEVRAVEGNNPETKPESNISSSTKKVLRKVGRRSMDETCKLTNDTATCEKEKLEHKKANLADKKDTEKRQKVDEDKTP